MKVLVCGGRKFTDWGLLLSVMDEINSRTPITRVIHGGAMGADKMSGEWASKRRISCIIHHANWPRDGKAAGPIRNQAMLDLGKPDLVVAFPGGRGTADMVRRAKAAGVAVREVK